MPSVRRHILIGATAGLAALALPLAVQAQEYPAKPVTVVLGYPPGGLTDVLIRAIAPRLTHEWKQPIVVDNRPGANEAIAAQLVSRAPADGYTLLMSTEAPLTQNPYLYRKLSYQPEKDLVPVALLATGPLALTVNSKVPVTTLEEFMALAKSRGATQPLAYATAGSGGSLHLPMAMLVKQHGLTMTHVPYKGVAPLLTDLVGGQVEVGWVPVAAVAPYVRDGRLRALVVDAPARLKALPQVPVFRETTVRAVQADYIFALTAPTGTPPAAIAKVSAAVGRIFLDPEFREKYLDPFGLVPVGSTPAELADYLAKDRPRQAERIRESGATLD